jgi:hypothetical protein
MSFLFRGNKEVGQESGERKTTQPPFDVKTALVVLPNIVDQGGGVRSFVIKADDRGSTMGKLISKPEFVYRLEKSSNMPPLVVVGAREEMEKAKVVYSAEKGIVVTIKLSKGDVTQSIKIDNKHLTDTSVTGTVVENLKGESKVDKRFPTGEKVGDVPLSGDPLGYIVFAGAALHNGDETTVGFEIFPAPQPPTEA